MRTQWILGGQPAGQPGSPFWDEPMGPMPNIHRQSGWWFQTQKKTEKMFDHQPINPYKMDN